MSIQSRRHDLQVRFLGHVGLWWSCYALHGSCMRVSKAIMLKQGCDLCAWPGNGLCGYWFEALVAMWVIRWLEAVLASGFYSLMFIHYMEFLLIAGGSLFLFDRKTVRYFRKDGHNWRKKADGKTVRETHEKLKVCHVCLCSHLEFFIFWYPLTSILFYVAGGQEGDA